MELKGKRNEGSLLRGAQRRGRSAGGGGFCDLPPSSCWVLPYPSALPRLHFVLLSPHFAFRRLSTHLVQVDGMEAHLGRSELRELG